jgi:ribosome-associated protein
MTQDDPADSRTISLRGEYITLAQAVKAAGLAHTGGQAKLMIRERMVAVNGAAAEQPGRKLRAGDRFGLAGGEEWTITE